MRYVLLLALAAVPPQVAHGQSASATLGSVVASLEAHQREVNVGQRLQAGLPVERLPDITLAGARSEGGRAREALAALAAIREDALTAEERLTLRTLRWQLPLDAEAPTHYWLDFSAVTPYATVLQVVAQAFAAHTFSDDASADRYVRLLQQVAPLVDTVREGVAERARRGIRIPRDELPLVLTLLHSYRQAPESSAFLPRSERLQRLTPTARRRVLEEGRRVVSTGVNPAFDRLVAVLDDSAYRNRAPGRVGQWQYPGGREYYRYLVRRHTTMDVTPREVHDVGLREVQRIEREMAAIRRELGFAGTAVEFLASLRRDPRFYANTPDEVGARLASYVRRIEPVVPQFFSAVPKARGDARRLDPRLEPAMTFGYYQQPTATDSMGHYFYNGSKLSERSLITAAPLIYHELVPGHHYQIARQLENTSLPELRRHSYLTAYNEGWGDYASALAGEMGMYADPYERYGRLFMDMFIACRLVVDTGMNEFGWSRDSARAYMAARVIESPAQLETETLRYSADLPGQALAYKMGALEITRLREWARATLGSRFDIRAFHEVVLGSGALPLRVLRSKVEDWVRTQSAGG